MLPANTSRLPAMSGLAFVCNSAKRHPIQIVTAFDRQREPQDATQEAYFVLFESGFPMLRSIAFPLRLECSSNACTFFVVDVEGNV